MFTVSPTPDARGCVGNSPRYRSRRFPLFRKHTMGVFIHTSEENPGVGRTGWKHLEDIQACILGINVPPQRRKWFDTMLTM